MSRTKLYQLINIAKSQLGLDDDTYRQMLTRFGAKAKNGRISATRMNLDQLQDVLNHFKSKGFVVKPIHKSPNKPIGKLAYVRVLVTKLNRPKSYGDALAWKIFGLTPLDNLTEYQLNKIIGELRKQCEREQVK